MSTFQPSDSAPLKAAITRGLRTLASAIAECVGPSQWGISPYVSDLRSEAKVALEYLFQVSRFSHFNLYSTNKYVCSRKCWTSTSHFSPIRCHKSAQLWRNCLPLPYEIPCTGRGYLTGARSESEPPKRKASAVGRRVILRSRPVVKLGG